MLDTEPYQLYQLYYKICGDIILVCISYINGIYKLTNFNTVLSGTAIVYQSPPHGFAPVSYSGQIQLLARDLNALKL